MADLTAKINRVATNVKNSLSEVANKGVTVPASANSDNLPALIASIESGTELTLTATTKSGATVTATKGDLSVSGVADSNGVCVLAIPEDGTWYVVATLSGMNSIEKEIFLGSNIDTTLAFISETLNDNDWPTISAASDSDMGQNYWSIGDRKAITVNGLIGNTSFSNETFYAFIIGFNHNGSYEGERSIHFQLAKSALSGGTDIALCDDRYGETSSATGYFSINSSNSNNGGWETSQMRTKVLGQSLSNYNGTLLGAIPSDLRAVLKRMTKYTNNDGGTNDASAVTATTEYFTLLSEFEITGTCTNSNATEKNYQQQYAYYEAGNSKVKYDHRNNTNAVFHWTRSSRNSGSTGFVRINTSGVASYTGCSTSYGIAPIFSV